jgi:CO/xanthine dehydrogenase Mo-binding subunit
MSGTTSRRDFLRVALSSAGALMLEVSLPGCGGGLRSLGMSKRPDGVADFVPNAHIKIGVDDKVSFVLDRVEMGQGTMTANAQLVAEELEIAPHLLGVELAGSHDAYNNTLFQMQLTGGSSSTPSSWTALRQAAATAREMLRQAAARKWGVPLEQCKAEDGAIVHTPSSRHLRYGELATLAAEERLAQPPALKEPKDWKWIGKPVTRRDAKMKVDGTAMYGMDVNLPDMRTAFIVRPPGYGATLEGFDATEALKEPGVEQVFAIPQGVAVVAKTYWRARRGADKLKVTWTATDANKDTELFTKAYKERVSRDAPIVHSTGGHAEALATAAQTLEAYYELPFLAHATMEPQNATAWYHDGKLDIWAPTQSPSLSANAARKVTGMSASDINVTQTLLGGGFGRRIQTDFVEEAVHVAMRVKHPVKVVWSREDDIKNEGYRPMVTNFLRGTVNKEGEITSWLHRLTTQSIIATAGDWAGMFLPRKTPISAGDTLGKLGTGMVIGLAMRGGGADPTSLEGAAELPYELPSFQIEYAPVEPGVLVGSWRSVGVSHTIFVVESFLDELAHAAKKDPYELRRALLPKGSRELGVLTLAAEKAGWDKPAPEGVFRGIAMAKSFNSYCAQVAEITVDQKKGLKVRRVVAAIDCGTVINPDIVRMQVESSIAFGLGAALKQKITLKKGVIEQSNFHDFEPLRMYEMPDVEVHIVDSKAPPTGVGEPGLPPIAPAVANAIFRATGKRIRRLPISDSFPELLP